MRKLIRGNTVTEEIYQLNCALVDGDLQEKATKTTPGAEKSSPTSTSKPSTSTSTSTSPPSSSVKQEKAAKKKT
jgi:hypothetical protein